VIAFVSKSETACCTLREVAGSLSQSVFSCADVQEARRAIRWQHPKIVACEVQVRDSDYWKVQAIFVAKLDRLTRSGKDLCELLERFERRVWP